jgi:hypothetical protein
MYDLRAQITRLQQVITDIGRNVTLAIVFGSAVIAYAIWTHRKVPAVAEPTVTTMEKQHTHTPEGEDHEQTIIHTHGVSAPAKPAALKQPEPHPSAKGSTAKTVPPADHNEPPPPSAINPPGQ